MVAPHSTVVDPQLVAKIRGVFAVSMPVPEHPRIDAQGPTVEVAGHAIGGRLPTLMCGPCSVESKEQIDAIAARLAPLGVTFLRGGAFKPAQLAVQFSGTWGSGARLDARCCDEAWAPRGREVLSEHDVSLVAEQSRSDSDWFAQHAKLCAAKKVGKTGKPVLLKRAMSATVEEWLWRLNICCIMARAESFCVNEEFVVLMPPRATWWI